MEITMRALLSSLVVTAVVLAALPGCSKKIELDPKTTVGYDKARDGEPKTMGGPVGKPGGKGKGGGIMAPPVDNP
jgi:hypothetical protein